MFGWKHRDDHNEEAVEKSWRVRPYSTVQEIHDPRLFVSALETCLYFVLHDLRDGILPCNIEVSRMSEI